jgi:hypothetical protein
LVLAVAACASAAELRRRERDTHHSPLAALSAHALDGDRECRLDPAWTTTSPVVVVVTEPAAERRPH